MRESILTKELVTSKIISRIILVSFSVISIALSAYVRIPLPFTPVPITFQTMSVLLFAGLLRERLATLSIFCYLILGLSGMPVFTFGGGIYYLIGPTGGYLIGFVLSSFFVGKAISYFKKIDFISVFISLFLGDIVILTSGTLWLRFFLNFKQAFFLGFLPFVPFDLVKLLIATKLFLKLNPRIREII